VLEEDIVRFFDKVSYSDDCWEWTGGVSGSGYGVFSLKGKARSSHRVSYDFFYEEDCEGMNVCHDCDNKLCINPFHLFLGTAKDNIQDMVSKNRHRSQIKKHCVNGHEFTEENTIIWGRGSRVCLVCYKKRRLAARDEDNRKRREKRKLKQPRKETK